MASTSALKATFSVDRSVDGVVTLTIKTRPDNKLGGLGLFFVIAAGMYLTAILGSYNPDIRGAAGPILMPLMGFLVFVGVALKMFMAWSARKTSGIISFEPATRTLSHQGLQWLFKAPQFQLPPDAVLGLDAVTVRHGASSKSRSDRSVWVRLWCLPGGGRSADEIAQMVESHRHAVFPDWFRSIGDAPLPEGATLLGVATENPIFRRIAVLLAESGACTAYDATGLQTGILSSRPVRTLVIAEPERFVISTLGLGMKIFAMLFATVVIAFISLIALNPFLFVYLWLLIVMALTTSQILVVDHSGVTLQLQYFFGLWRRGQAERRWDEISAIQVEKSSNGLMCLAIRREDGDNLQVILPSTRAGARIEQRLKQLISSEQQA